MIDFIIQTHIDRPVDEVFAHATDPAKLPTWQTNTVSSAPDGPLGVGTRLHEVHRGPRGREIATVVQISEYRPHEAFGLRMLEGPLPLDAHLTFEPREGGTILRFRSFGQPTGAMRLAQPLLRRALRRQFSAHCDNLKRVLET